MAYYLVRIKFCISYFIQREKVLMNILNPYKLEFFFYGAMNPNFIHE